MPLMHAPNAPKPTNDANICIATQHPTALSDPIDVGYATSLTREPMFFGGIP
jgi:hypothetical protein